MLLQCGNPKAVLAFLAFAVHAAPQHIRAGMLYSLYEAGYYGSTPLRMAARMTRDFWSSPLNPGRDSELGRRLYASADLLANLTRRYGRPAWGIDSVTINGLPV